MPTLRCVPLANRGVIRVAGRDARRLLQGLISNDLDHLAPDRPLYAALLTPQGKYLYDFIISDDGATLLLDTERARLGSLIQRLTLYRLRAEVTFSDESERLAVLAVFDRGPVPDSALPPGSAHRDPRVPELGLRVVLPRDAVQGFIAEHGLIQVDPVEYDRLRLSLGVPDGSRDLVVEKSLLLESGFEELHGVSFTKGCFVGQELTARTKHRGLIKRRLLPVRVDGPLPPPGTPVTRGGRDAGEMRSGAGNLGLALLRLDALRTSEEPLLAGEAVLAPAPPPWLPMAAMARL
jgi:folate-binding protein YgfZ